MPFDGERVEDTARSWLAGVNGGLPNIVTRYNGQPFARITPCNPVRLLLLFSSYSRVASNFSSLASDAAS